jgi:formamidopyrimidine-DNA glycosylase
MPELPEIAVIASQMSKILLGKEIQSIDIFQPKCTNRPVRHYQKILPGSKVTFVRPLGKWIELSFQKKDRLLINLGMGGEIRHFKHKDKISEKCRFLLHFMDGTGFFVTFWWFGYVHLVCRGESHPMTDSLGPDPTELSRYEFVWLFNKRRGSLKSFLLDQKKLRGIGNYYIQEILFRARLHPLREIGLLKEEEKIGLYKAIQTVFQKSITLGSSDYELDFFGKKGRYGLKQMATGYKPDTPCPKCRSKILKIQTGGSSQFICPKCQSL